MKKKQLIITGSIVAFLALAFGVYAMTNNNEEDNKVNESTFTNPISEQKPAENPVVEDPETVPIEEEPPVGGGDSGQNPPAVVDPTSSASQTFSGNTGTITVKINPGSFQLEAVSASVGGSDLGAKRIPESGSVTFSYHTVDGKPINTVVVTIYDKAGKTYQSTHQL